MGQTFQMTKRFISFWRLLYIREPKWVLLLNEATKMTEIKFNLPSKIPEENRTDEQTHYSGFVYIQLNEETRFSMEFDRFSVQPSRKDKEIIPDSFLFTFNHEGNLAGQITANKKDVESFSEWARENMIKPFIITGSEYVDEVFA